MTNILTVNGVRILTPTEYRKIREFMNPEHKRLFDGLLFTGMRSTEYTRFLNNLDWLDSDRKIIRIGKKAVLKNKVVNVDRSVLLSNWGYNAIEQLVDYPTPMLGRAWFGELLVKAATRAGLDTTGICPKMSRKTWECWLMVSYPESLAQILLSQGHTFTTAINHYLGIGFIKEEKSDIKQYTDGWLR